jgi:hypothetical protein
LNPVYIETLVRLDLQARLTAAATQATKIYKSFVGDIQPNNLPCVMIIPDETPIDTSGGQPGSRLQQRTCRVILLCVGVADTTPDGRDATEVAESLASEVEDALFDKPTPGQFGIRPPILPNAKAYDIRVFKTGGLPDPTTGLRKPGFVAIHIEVSTATPEGQSSMPVAR